MPLEAALGQLQLLLTVLKFLKFLLQLHLDRSKSQKRHSTILISNKIKKLKTTSNVIAQNDFCPPWHFPALWFLSAPLSSQTSWSSEFAHLGREAPPSCHWEFLSEFQVCVSAVSHSGGIPPEMTAASKSYTCRKTHQQLTECIYDELFSNESITLTYYCFLYDIEIESVTNFLSCMHVITDKNKTLTVYNQLFILYRWWILKLPF